VSPERVRTLLHIRLRRLPLLLLEQALLVCVLLRLDVAETLRHAVLRHEQRRGAPQGAVGVVHPLRRNRILGGVSLAETRDAGLLPGRLAGGCLRPVHGTAAAKGEGPRPAITNGLPCQLPAVRVMKLV